MLSPQWLSTWLVYSRGCRCKLYHRHGIHLSGFGGCHLQQWTRVTGAYFVRCTPVLCVHERSVQEIRRRRNRGPRVRAINQPSGNVVVNDSCVAFIGGRRIKHYMCLPALVEETFCLRAHLLTLRNSSFGPNLFLWHLSHGDRLIHLSRYLPRPCRLDCNLHIPARQTPMYHGHGNDRRNDSHLH